MYVSLWSGPWEIFIQHPNFVSAKGRSIRTNVRNKEVRQPDSSDEAAEQRSPDSGGGSGAKRADQGEPNESKHRLDSDPGSDDTGDTLGSFSGTQCSS